MSFYEDRILPPMIKLACGNSAIARQRQMVVPEAEGRVLEVGMGPGLNIPFYNPDKVEMVWGLEPSQGMRRVAQKNLDAARFPVEWLDLPGEQIPLEDNSADTVLLTYTLCTIPGWREALEGMRRVLKPGGKLIFCEHGRAPDAGVHKWQNRLNSHWRKMAGGCNINRPIAECIEETGFIIGKLENEYIRKTPKIVGYTYRGFASPD
jgi:ubiquinone/menaquinone biosynthesis C-methylase UbiE